jgi:hypothetical protein
MDLSLNAAKRLSGIAEKSGAVAFLNAGKERAGSLARG